MDKNGCDLKFSEPAKTSGNNERADGMWVLVLIIVIVFAEGPNAGVSPKPCTWECVAQDSHRLSWCRWQVYLIFLWEKAKNWDYINQISIHIIY